MGIMPHAFSIAAQQISIYSVFLKLFSFWIQMASSMALSFYPLRLLFLTLIFFIAAGSDAVLDLHSHRQRRHTAIVVSSIVAACVFLCLLLCFFFVCCYRRRQRKQRKRLNRDIFERLFSSNVQTSRNVTVGGPGQATKYAKWHLEKATDSFSPDNIIGSSNISTVYKGVIRGIDWRRDTIIALKILDIENTTQVERFLNNDVDILCRIKHRNLVEVVGSSWPGDQIVALVTKFVPNGNLGTAIHSVEEGCGLPLNLTKRLNIIISTGQTIVYLHNLCDSPIVHCHLRSTNILLDEDFEVRLSDYGTADMLWSHLQLECIASSSASGAAIGYIAPEVAVMTSAQVSPKADVYSFGVILMELLTKRRPIISIVSEGGERTSLRQWIASDINGGGVAKLVDPALAENISEKEGEKMINLLKISLLCTKETPDDRPSMSQVLSWLVNIKHGRMECNLGF